MESGVAQTASMPQTLRTGPGSYNVSCICLRVSDAALCLTNAHDLHLVSCGSLQYHPNNSACQTLVSSNAQSCEEMNLTGSVTTYMTRQYQVILAASPLQMQAHCIPFYSTVTNVARY